MRRFEVVLALSLAVSGFALTSGALAGTPGETATYKWIEQGINQDGTRGAVREGGLTMKRRPDLYAEYKFTDEEGEILSTEIGPSIFPADDTIEPILNGCLMAGGVPVPMKIKGKDIPTCRVSDKQTATHVAAVPFGTALVVYTYPDRIMTYRLIDYKEGIKKIEVETL